MRYLISDEVFDDTGAERIGDDGDVIAEKSDVIGGVPALPGLVHLFESGDFLNVASNFERSREIHR